MFPDKPGVMAARELTADDVVYNFNRQNSARRRPTASTTTSTRSRRRPLHGRLRPEGIHRRLGLPLRLRLLLGDHAEGGRRCRRHRLEEHQRHRSVHAHRLRRRATPTPTRRTRSTGTRRRSTRAEFKLPFVDKLIYRIIKDESTRVTALRTGKLDILEVVRWQNVDSLKKSAPAAQVEHGGSPPAARCWRMRTDTEAVRRHPRAPRAEHGGQQGRDHQGLLQRQRRAVRLSDASAYGGYYEPLSSMPDSRSRSCSPTIRRRRRSCWPKPAIRTASPSRCRSASCSSDHMDLLPLVAAYLEQVGVKIEIQPMEYAAFLSAMTHQDRTRRATS